MCAGLWRKKLVRCGNLEFATISMHISSKVWYDKKVYFLFLTREVL